MADVRAHEGYSDLQSHPVDAASDSPEPEGGPETGRPGQGRTLGIAAAPEELLQAAAEAAAAMKREGLLDDVLEGLSTDVVGPAPPPELVEQLTGASTDVREKQVKRIMALKVGSREAGAVAPERACLDRTVHRDEPPLCDVVGQEHCNPFKCWQFT